MRKQRKYYKEELLMTVCYKSLLPEIQKLLHNKLGIYWCYFNLNTNKFRFADITGTLFSEIIGNSKTTWKHKLFHFIQYKLKISFNANRKNLQTILIEQFAIMSITNDKSNEHKTAMGKYSLLESILSAKGFPHVRGTGMNYSCAMELVHLLLKIGLKEQGNTLSNIWLNSKIQDHTKRRIEFRKARKEQLLSMIEN